MAQLILEHAALLVIDLQRGILKDCHDVGGIVERTSQLVSQARASGLSVL
ncbi:hypothetical protein [Glutamicibacter sp.]|nr:hypothetical protein [Glutamicibacter sp.]